MTMTNFDRRGLGHNKFYTCKIINYFRGICNESTTYGANVIPETTIKMCTMAMAYATPTANIKSKNTLSVHHALAPHRSRKLVG